VGGPRDLRAHERGPDDDDADPERLDLGAQRVAERLDGVLAGAVHAGAREAHAADDRADGSSRG
jgi:hypothetical protein